MKNLIDFMKNNKKTLISFTLIACIFFGFNMYSSSSDPKNDKALISLLRMALTQGHYEPHVIDDTFSENVYNRFVDQMDPTKRYFLKSDIKDFEVFKHLIDDQIKNEDLSFFYLVHDRFNLRLQEAEDNYKEILKRPFNFNKDETLSVDYENMAYSKSKSKLILRWKKQLKHSTINRLHDKLTVENDKKEKDATYKAKSFKELEKEARESTEEFMSDFYDRMDELEQADWFTSYVNAITEEFDPHTAYFDPKYKKRFDQSMSGKLEGIGARLQKSKDYTKVAELISGGPAWKGGELEVGDLIIKVAQGDEEAVDIVGMRLDKAIEYIKGKKGTTVNLTLKKIDGSIQVISIVRDIIEIEETFVKSSVIEKDGRTFGLINLPKFYIDFSEKNARNSTSDMIKEIERLKEQNVEGLVIDLRNNGGGSLKTAIEISGLFIDKGPMVQVKYRGKDASIKKDTDKRIQWDGPLVLMVNELSASASEIFAAAMQDYKRAVIIGPKHTYGKGTVQSVYDLNRYHKLDADLGALKMTIQKFYRINGGSTQLEGVTSDVIVPTRFSYMTIGEKDLDNPLGFDKIPAADYELWNNYANFNEVISSSIERIGKSEQFKLIDKNAQWLKEAQEDNTVYLNYKAYKKDIKFIEDRSAKFKKLAEYKSDFTYQSPLYEIEKVKQDSLLLKKREIWHKNLQKDVYITEALTVLGELKIKTGYLAIKQ